MQYTIPSAKEGFLIFHHKGHIQIFKKVRKSHIIRINGLCLCEMVMRHTDYGWKRPFIVIGPDSYAEHQ